MSRPPRRNGHRPATLGIHAGAPPRRSGEPVVPPLVQSATFFWGGPEEGELRYTRYGNNPNQRGLGEKIAALEGMEAALVLGSGMAATAMTLLALAGAGSHVLASRRLYGATQTLLRDELSRRGIATTFVDPDDEGGWRAAIRPGTRVIMVEIPTNPTLRVLDPRPLAALCREHGALLVCDATFASPVNLRAGEVGVDVVIHSATKYLGGHSDLIAGAVAGPAEVVEEVTRMAQLYGPALDPHAAWLLDRGLRTLDVRMRRHNESALALAHWFQGQERVADVVHPGLEHHPDHGTAAELLDGFGGMLGVVLRGGAAAADAFTRALEVAVVAPSLGGVETLVSQPRHTSHRSLAPEERRAQGIPDGFVRISVGMEDVEDLKEDFSRALASLP